MITETLKLVYTLLCDDVRIEMGNKISLRSIEVRPPAHGVYGLEPCR